MKIRNILFAAIAFAAVGCRQEMRTDSRLKPYQESPFFADRGSSRPLVDGVVPRGEARLDDFFFRGEINGRLVRGFPSAVTFDQLKKGQERYNIYCSVCHGISGTGDGMVVQRGFPKPPSLDEQRLRDAPEGHFFNVITNGYGAMYSYASRIEPSEYPWAGLAFSHGAEVIRQRAIYLNIPGVVVRAVVSFAVWIGLAWLLVWRSSEADKARSRTDLVSGLGLVLFAVVTSFAFIDWLMAVEPAWYSSIFPAIVLVGQILCALAFGFFYSLPKFYEQPDSGELLIQVSNLLLAFVLMWTYLSISQIIIIYAGDLPHEIGWYLRRTRGGWLWLGLFLAVFGFGLPFVLLLFRGLKKSRFMLITITMMQLVAQAIATFWYTAPAYRHVLRLRWTDPVAFFGIGLAWLLIFRRQARREPQFQSNQS